MKVCVYGAGAVGGLIGAALGAAGCEVSVIARGETLAAVRKRGLAARLPEGELCVPVRASDDPAELGAQDLVVLGVKGPALGAVAARIGPLLGPRTVVLPAMNGVPWWFFDGFGGPYAGSRLRSVDPDGTIAAAIPAASVVGCVVHFASSCPEPGIAKLNSPKRPLIIGEPAGGASERLARLEDLLGNAGFAVTVSERIQTDVWYKLWGNMTMNPVSALCGATTDRIIDDPLVKAFCLSVMAEASEIGARIGCPIAQTGLERMALTRELGSVKTSMLQDAEAGKSLELDALVGAVREIGALVGVPTPSADALFGLVRLFARSRGLYS